VLKIFRLKAGKCAQPLLLRLVHLGSCGRRGADFTGLT
jgi:hypothetical protein